ncbi:MAG TPA: nucleotidyltransferase family protein [Bryobacteraceae bacterium]|nr:nucleotidyltransferase family protein [Bryobacteraceae bacterium]
MLPCAILCGGLATRLRPITEKIPKSLIPINGEPFIAHQLRLLRSNDVEKIVLCVGHLGEMIQKFVGPGTDYGLRVSYSFDGAQLLGTAGAIRKALPLLGEPFFVLYGDSYLTCNYGEVAEAFSSSNSDALMTIYRNEDRFDTSNVEADRGLILRYDKRNRVSRMHHIDYGLSAFKQSIFRELPENEVSDLSELCQKLAASGQLAGYEVKERFYEIGSEKGIQDLERYLTESDTRKEKQSGQTATKI